MTPATQRSTDNTIIKTKGAPQTNQAFIRPKQSANVLFKCMKRLDYLKSTLKMKAIVPRYYEEKINYLNIKEIDKIAFPMSCFCDIHLNKLIDHMGNYGDFAIGMNKDWGITQGIQPIHYINEYSALRKDFSSIFNHAKNATDDQRNDFSTYNNYLLMDLLFMKPLEGEMMTDKGYETRNFHDEREWRFVPNINEVDTELPLVIEQQQMNEKSYGAYSDGIQTRPDLWLKFELSAIKYIIVTDKSSKMELINFLRDNDVAENEEEFFDLVSKIMVFNDLKEDW
ncbi:abortive infection system antitoxin AbiGi family protein [Priestia aryabhattai]|uniref:abortive infection system antitoxin AbiGi family protein n=1 Tax=Priestia aryabhattai TaxID=412384 RepID=UPI002E1EF832|nr:abortive infection system antitoxin AbiGi family protein [Priestia aryabhattai]